MSFVKSLVNAPSGLYNSVLGRSTKIKGDRVARRRTWGDTLQSAYNTAGTCLSTAGNGLYYVGSKVAETAAPALRSTANGIVTYGPGVVKAPFNWLTSRNPTMPNNTDYSTSSYFARTMDPTSFSQIFDTNRSDYTHFNRMVPQTMGSMASAAGNGNELGNPGHTIYPDLLMLLANNKALAEDNETLKTAVSTVWDHFTNLLSGLQNARSVLQEEKPGTTVPVSTVLSWLENFINQGVPPENLFGQSSKPTFASTQRMSEAQPTMPSVTHKRRDEATSSPAQNEEARMTASRQVQSTVPTANTGYGQFSDTLSMGSLPGVSGMVTVGGA